MAIAPLRVLLVLVGILIVGAGIAYYTDFMNAEAPEAIAEAPVQSAAREQAAGADADTGESETLAMAELDEAEPGDVVVPAFDLLRAEPDGSLVLAGRAAPGSEVEIVSGSSVLAKVAAGPEGDFVAVLDERLKPGEHNIVLRSTSAENVAATSLETAMVSVPSNESGQLVALVQQPGEPSRLITAPAPPASGGQVAEQVNDGQTSLGNAVDGQRDETGDLAEAPAAGGAEQFARAGDETAGDVAAEDEGASAAASAREEAASDEIRDTRLGDAEARVGEAAEADTSPFIEAVEIEGRKVFVAGRAEAGRTLRVYANDVLLGQTHVTPEGRFLIEAERELPVGDYIIRADILDDDGTVSARAAVPFERHIGENIAAVAPGAFSQQGLSSGNGERTAGEGSAGERGNIQEGGGGRAGDVPGGVTAAQGLSDRDGVAEVVSPALQSVDGAVIIRRGDTLWQISRRIYGRGVRYTTIYLANQEQIRNPDRIWPGQIFTVPERTEEGEEADLGAVGDQALTPEEASAQDTRVQ